MRTMAIILAMGLTGAAGAAPYPGGETITYARGPCFGTCPVYSVKVWPDGRGVFTGERFTATMGERRFRVSPAQYAEFRRRLIADRAVGTVDLGGPAGCTSFATDHPTIRVEWTGQRTGKSVTIFNTGCGGHERKARALERAPAALPIAGFIGKR